MVWNIFRNTSSIKYDKMSCRTRVLCKNVFYMPCMHESILVTYMGLFFFFLIKLSWTFISLSYMQDIFTITVIIDVNLYLFEIKNKKNKSYKCCSLYIYINVNIYCLCLVVVGHLLQWCSCLYVGVDTIFCPP